MRTAALLRALCLLACLPAGATAQTYPQRPVKIVVPFTAGTATDTVARALAQIMTPRLGQQVIVENREGAGGAIANGVVGTAPADGHTVLMSTVSVVVVPLLYKEFFFDPRSLAPVTLLVDVPNVICATPRFEAGTLKDLLAMARAQPGRLRYVNSGKGSPAYLTMELLKGMAGIDIEEVPYKNSSQALVDVISGVVPLYSLPLVTAMPHLKSGKLRALAVASTKRSTAMPDLPAAGEIVAGYDPGTGAYGLMLPAKTGADIVTRLNAETVAATRDPGFRERMVALGAEIVGSSQQEYAAYLVASHERWTRLFRQINVTPQ